MLHKVLRCLNPLCILNSAIGLPLTSTDNEADSLQAFVHFIHTSQKPNLLSMR